MTNHEEYEVLKGLDDKWKWIARDEAQQMYAYEYHPIKSKLRGQWESNWNDYYPFPHDWLQFIQWEDEEPYNIQELIEEYEKDCKGSWEHAIEFSKEMRREGEETEVKNIEWLKEIISLERKLLSESLMGAQETEVERIFNDGKKHGLIFASNRINQLDEPEVSSQEWISEKSIDTHVDTVNGEIQVTSIPDDLKELLVPNQEITFEQAYEKLREESVLSEKSFDYYWNCINDNVEIDEPGNLLVPEQEVIERHGMSESEWAEVIDRYKWHLEQEGYVVIEKPTIPQFIADWVEESRNRGYNIRGVFERAPEIVEKWLYFQDDGERIIYLGLAYLLDEYEVEERELTVKEVIEEHIELLKKQEVAVNLKPYYDLWKELKEYEELEKEPDAKKITEKNTKY